MGLADCVGAKTIELRSWSTRYRGPLLICSSAARADGGPRGVACAEVELLDVRPVRPDDASAARHKIEGGFAWVLGGARIVAPRPVRGRLGLFEA